MSASAYRSQLERKRAQRVEAEKKAGEFRSKESRKRAEAGAAKAAAERSRSAATKQSKLREADRRESGAVAAGKEAAKWQTRASGYAKDEASIAAKLARADVAEARATEQRRAREQAIAARQTQARELNLEQRMTATERTVEHAVRQLRAPRPEKLRVLLLGASSLGDLRVGREQARIRAAVMASLHRDLVELDARPAATASDLLDGITRFRPHVVHFSGHSDDDLIELEADRDEPHPGVIVSAGAFAAAVRATDDPPLLVLLNSCNSARQIDALVESVAPFAIGMADEIDDGDAITYAAQFYAAVANGQSIQSAHASGQAALQLAGLQGADLPTLAWAPDVDPATAVLVQPEV